MVASANSSNKIIHPQVTKIFFFLSAFFRNLATTQLSLLLFKNSFRHLVLHMILRLMIYWLSKLKNGRVDNESLIRFLAKQCCPVLHHLITSEFLNNVYIFIKQFCFVYNKYCMCFTPSHCWVFF